MLNIDELDDKFSVEGEVGFAELENDLIFITVSNKHADADICLYGAHITNFKPHRTMEVLWMSSESNFQEGSPIRGGIPVCFPWFGPHKTDAEKPMHGFARLMYWEVLEIKAQATGETLVRLQLCSSEETKVYWNHDFCAEMIIVVGKTLSVTLKVSNTSSEPLDYTSALHSYFSLSAIENIRIEGLQNTKYIDQIESVESTQQAPTLEIKKAETRHYYDTEATCVIHDGIFGRRISVAKLGSKITTVWNPGEACSKMDDLADDAYHTFVCVETVNAFNNVIKLAPGETHETVAMIGLEE
jgi:glucose-6-phosphate 1-epimerase